jgi:hypothetical protein
MASSRYLISGFNWLHDRDVRANDSILQTYTHVVSGTNIHISCKTNTHHSARVHITDQNEPDEPVPRLCPIKIPSSPMIK